MKRITFTIPGRPVARQEPLWGRGHMRAHPLSAEYKRTCRAYASKAAVVMKVAEPYSGPVELSLMCVFPPESRLRKWQRDRIAAGGLLRETRKRGDHDNLAKIPSDAFEGIFYLNDSQIVDSHVYRRQGLVPRTEVTVTFWDEEQP